MKKYLLYACVTVALFGFTSYGCAAAQSGSKIILPKIKPSQALIYFTRQINQAAYVGLNASALDRSAREKLIVKLNEKKESVKGVFYTGNADHLRETYATVPTHNQSFFELSKFHISRILRVAVSEISKATNRTVSDILSDEKMVDALVTAGIIGADAIKVYCIIRALQCKYKSPMDEDAFGLFTRDAQEITEAFVQGIRAGEATIKLQDPNPLLDAIWENSSYTDRS